MKLTTAEQTRWLQCLGGRHAYCVDRTLLAIFFDRYDAIVIDAPVSHALYIVVDADDEVRYVGKVDRSDGTVADRFRDHDAYEPHWDRVWVIPLSPGLEPKEVSDWELTLISHFDPVDNKLGRGRIGKW